MMRWIARFIMLAAVAAAGATTWVGLLRYSRIVTPVDPPGGGPIAVRIMPGTPVRSAARALQDAGVIRDPKLLVRFLAWSHVSEKVKAGVYTFQEPVSLLDVSRKLLKGEQERSAVLIKEGSDRWDAADALEDAGICARQEFLTAASDPGLIRDLDPIAPDLEGYLFPDTYYFAGPADAAAVARAMVERFRHKLDPDWQTRAARLGLSLRQVVVLASIIEKETGDRTERRIISSVFHNRLRRNISLGADPTIIYALKLRGVFDGNIRKRDLQDPSPYNTYVHSGLPPGPIANPGLESIRAALDPASTEYVFFVSMNNGRHQFSRTLEEHNRAVNKYQKEYWREVWRREKSAG